MLKLGRYPPKKIRSSHLKVRQQRNRTIVVCVSVIFSFKNKIIFAIFSLVGYIPVEIEIFIISANILLITFDEYFNMNINHEIC